MGWRLVTSGNFTIRSDGTGVIMSVVRELCHIRGIRKSDE